MQGVIMGIIFLTFCELKAFRRKIYAIYTLICVLALPLAYQWWLLHQEQIYRDKLLTAVINVWIIGIFVIYHAVNLHAGSLRIKQALNVRSVMAILLLGWIFLSRNEDIWSLWYMGLFGLFYLTDKSEEERKVLANGMLDGLILSYFLLQGAAFAFRPFDGTTLRYNGIYANCNINGLFYAVVFAAVLLRLMQLRQGGKNRWMAIVYVLVAVTLLDCIALTVSITATFTVTVIGVIYAIAVEMHFLQKPLRKVLAQILGMIAAAALCFPITFLAVRYFPTILHHPIWYDGEYNEDKVHSFDPRNSEKYVSFDEYMEGVGGKLSPYWQLISSKLGLSIEVHAQEYGLTIGDEFYSYRDDDVQKYASALGRIAMWDYYVRNSNWIGHSNLEGHNIGDGGYIWHAQNVYIQYMYYYGIPAMILLIAYLVTTFIGGVRQIIAGNELAVIPLLYLCLFAIEGLLEAVWYPGQMSLLLIFFTPIFLYKKQAGKA